MKKFNFNLINGEYIVSYINLRDEWEIQGIVRIWGISKSKLGIGWVKRGERGFSWVIYVENHGFRVIHNYVNIFISVSLNMRRDREHES